MVELTNAPNSTSTSFPKEEVRVFGVEVLVATKTGAETDKMPCTWTKDFPISKVLGSILISGSVPKVFRMLPVATKSKSTVEMSMVLFVT